MDTISSTEFRKRFARVTEPTVVTVNGHVIGEWRPTALRQILAHAEAEDQRWKSEFRPVPKPSQRKP